MRKFYEYKDIPKNEIIIPKTIPPKNQCIFFLWTTAGLMSILAPLIGTAHGNLLRKETITHLGKEHFQDIITTMA